MGEDVSPAEAGTGADSGSSSAVVNAKAMGFSSLLEMIVTCGFC
jgi:hypothetical protein